MTRDDFASSYDRIKEATHARTQVELAEVLRIRQSSISDAKRRAQVPDSWLVKLLATYGLNPEWIKTGLGPRYLVGSDTPGEVTPGRWTTPPAPEPEPRTVSELIQAIKDREPGAMVFVAFGDAEALDVAALREMARDEPAQARG